MTNIWKPGRVNQTTESKVHTQSMTRVTEGGVGGDGLRSAGKYYDQRQLILKDPGCSGAILSVTVRRSQK